MDKKRALLKKYFCESPFTYSEIHQTYQSLCCPYWNTTDIKNSDNLLDNWNSDKAVEVRESMLDGTWKNCTEFCPHLDQLLKDGEPQDYPATPIRPIEEFNPNNYKGPKKIKLCFDHSCNLKCPSCRHELIPNSDVFANISKKFFDSISKDISFSLEEIFTSGTGDPFYSKPMRNFLESIDTQKFPKLRSIIIHTNGILWTPKIWEKMYRIHPMVTQCEISIDAATESTYKKIRVNGKWDTLLENLKYINTLPYLELINLSFVAQKDNYKEMEKFITLMSSIFTNKKYKIIFYKIADWGVMSEKEFLEKKVWDPNHKDYADFQLEADKLKNYKNLMYNFH